MTYNRFASGILAAAMLAACSDSQHGLLPEEPQMPGGETIVFEADAAEPTAAGVPPTTTLTIPEFKVTAYAKNRWGEDSMIMDNVIVTRTGLNSWTYDHPVKWPSTPVDFFAVSPASVQMINNQWWVHIAKFPWQGGDTDFLVCVRMGAIQGDGNIKLNFRHALARVKINLYTALSPAEDYEVRVGLVRITDFPDYGEFTFPFVTTSPDTNRGELFSCWGTYNSQSVRHTYFEAADPDGYITVPTRGFNLVEGSYFIPFNLTELQGGGTYYTGTRLEVAYQVVSRNDGRVLWPDGSVDYADRWGGGYYLSRLSLYDPTPSHRWEPGRSYTYNINFTIPSGTAKQPLKSKGLPSATSSAPAMTPSVTCVLE